MKIFFVFIYLFFGTPQPVETYDLEITVTNIDKIRGNIEMGIFNEAESFPLKGKAFKNYTKEVTNNTVVFHLKDITTGEYALAIFHDVNADKECNMNFIGIPKEPYGFSKNFKPKFSKPKFKDCKITVDENKSMTIKLID